MGRQILGTDCAIARVFNFKVWPPSPWLPLGYMTWGSLILPVSVCSSPDGVTV
ncbi:hypothetical protein M3J09_003273 [Ascochyta lentis]